MKPCFVLDACSLIAFFNDEPGAEAVENLLVEAKRHNIDLFINIINMLEIYYGVYREDGIDVANGVLEKIKNLPITIVDKLSNFIFFEAGRLKATYKISLADAIAAAEANVRNAHLVTADHHELDMLDKQKEIKAFWIR